MDQEERKEERSERKEERFEDRQWNEAVSDAKRGFDQLGKVDQKLDKEEPKRALLHLREAVGGFEAALTHIEKADVGQSRQGAVDSMNFGVKELNDAVTDLADGKIDSAQGHYDKAADSFGKAESILN